MMAEKEEYDLIYLDHKMPGMTGVETLYKLRKNSIRTPVYIVTAFYDEFIEAAGKGISIEVLKKPMSTEDIMAATTGALRGPVGV